MKEKILIGYKIADDLLRLKIVIPNELLIDIS